MKILTYECEDCKAIFEVTHESADDPVPDCPNCSRVLEWRPKGFSIGGSPEGKAADITYKMLEEDYGMTNFKDNNREGDIGVVMPRDTTAEKEKIEREIMEMSQQVTQPANPAASNAFWGGPSQGGLKSVTGQTLLASAKAGPAAGVDAMAALHDLGKQGKLPNNFKIIGRG